MSEDAMLNAMKYLKSLGASAVDVEFLSLCTDDNDTEGVDLLETCLDFFSVALASRQDFECVQAYLNRILRHHKDTILKLPALHENLQKVRSAHQITWSELEDFMQKNMCLLKYLCKIQS